MFSWLESAMGQWISGMLLAVVSLGITLWQLARTRRAAASAQRASRETRDVLRSSTLARALDASLEVGRRLDQTRRRELIVIYLGDWLAAYQRVHALVQNRTSMAVIERSAFTGSLERARGEVLIARHAAEAKEAWSRYSTRMRQTLSDYGRAVETLLLAIEDEAVGRSVR
jgi:hypothetical protein